MTTRPEPRTAIDEVALEEAVVMHRWLHRWDALASFNGGHEPFAHSVEYVDLMRKQQAAFDREAEYAASLRKPVTP